MLARRLDIACRTPRTAPSRPRHSQVMDMERRIKRTAKQQKKEDAQAEAFLNGE